MSALRRAGQALLRQQGAGLADGLTAAIQKAPGCVHRARVLRLLPSAVGANLTPASSASLPLQGCYGGRGGCQERVHAGRCAVHARLPRITKRPAALGPRARGPRVGTCSSGLGEHALRHGMGSAQAPEPQGTCSPPADPPPAASPPVPLLPPPGRAAVKQRMKSVGNIQKITKAMKMVAASKMRSAQASTMNSRGIVQPFIRLLGDLPAAEGIKNVLVPVTSDKGLCGGITSTVCK